MNIKKLVDDLSIREYLAVANFHYNDNDINCFLFRLCMPLESEILESENVIDTESNYSATKESKDEMINLNEEIVSTLKDSKEETVSTYLEDCQKYTAPCDTNTLDTFATNQDIHEYQSEFQSQICLEHLAVNEQAFDDSSCGSYYTSSENMEQHVNESSYETASEPYEEPIEDLFDVVSYNNANFIREDVHCIEDCNGDMEEEEDNVILVQDLEEMKMMAMMGLPTSFGKPKQKVPKNSAKKKKPKEKKKKSTPNDSLCPRLKRITLPENFSQLTTIPFWDDFSLENTHKKEISNIAHALDLTTVDCLGLEKQELDYVHIPQRTAIPDKYRDVTKFSNRVIEQHYRYRYDYFSKFDEGIELSDEEAWFSVTPEKMAKNMAIVCQCDTVIDGFCGAGGNVIQFGLECKKVIAIDISEKKLDMAKQNASVYGVANIDFVKGDFLEVSKGLKADVVFLSPPWGGPKYKRSESFELNKIENFEKIMARAKEITPNIALFLPRNTILEDLVKYTDEPFVVEQNFLGELFKGITVYYGKKFLDFYQAHCK